MTVSPVAKLLAHDVVDKGVSPSACQLFCALHYPLYLIEPVAPLSCLQLFWPDDHKWYLVEIQVVNPKTKQAKYVFSSWFLDVQLLVADVTMLSLIVSHVFGIPCALLPGLLQYGVR
jgi:hypothetical protein